MPPSPPVNPGPRAARRVAALPVLQLRLRAGRSSEGFAADGSSEEGLRDPLAGEEGEHIEHVPCRDARGRRTGGRRDGVVELCTRKVQGVG